MNGVVWKGNNEKSSFINGQLAAIRDETRPTSIIMCQRDNKTV